MFQLNQNFRTHAGILGLAQSVMDLLYYFFPLSVDKLIPEVSLICGEAPVLLESSNDENAILTIFGNSGSGQRCLSGFGAEQVILVRDTVTKEQIFDQIGKQALVLTILECKGLEFQDVLLYNFFGTSPLKKKWRVTYEYMKHRDILEPSVSRTFPSFELERHNLLCSELKQLYVAITRTKQRLWICENTDEYSKPMFDYWKRLCLVQERHLDSSLAQAMKVASSAEDWRLRGIELFNEGNFDLAAVCFEKAGDEYNEKWAKAAGLVAHADLIISTNTDMGEIALKRAAEIYESIDKPESAATCYIKLNDFKEAGMIYMEKCGISGLKDAADCFAMAECWTDAARAYAKGKFLSECLSVCSKGRIFETGLEIIEQWNEASCTDGRQKHELNEMISSYLENCAQHYLELGDIQRMMMFVKAFQSNDSNNLIDDLLTVELELGNYIEAASIARNKGNMLLEAEILEKANCFEEATSLLLLHVLMSSLWSSGNKGWPLKRYAEKENHLMKAKELAQWKSGSFQEYVFLEADILSDREKSLSDMSRHLVEAQKHCNLRQEVFSSRAILDVHIESKPSKFLHGRVSVIDSDKLVNDMVPQNCLSVDTMMYAWNLWKAVILDLLSYLDDPKLTKDGSRYEEFYLEYFGVRTLDEKNMYVIQNPEAYWVKNTVKFSLVKKKNLVWLSASKCISCAKSYWSTELFSVGMKLLECLQSLHNFYVERNLYSFCRGRVAIWIYEVAKFLIESELTSASSMNKVRGYYNLSQTWYFDIIFPLDWRNDTMENVIFLHENKTAMEIIDVSLTGILERRNGNLTHGQIGRLVMLLFLTGQLSDELFKMIMNCLTDMQPWRDFIEQYRTFLNFGFARFPVISTFECALQSSFNIYWKNEIDYLSPHCFIYLIECLVFFASSCRGLGGHFFTTKSSLLEMLKCHGCKGYMTACLSSVPDLSQNTVQLSLGYIIETIKILLGDKHQLFAWMNKSSMRRESYPLLALKLNKIYEDLPTAFSMQLLHQAKIYEAGGSFQFIRVFAEALRMVGNSLVIVCSEESPMMLSSLNALTINSEHLRCTEKVFALLFPEKKMIFQSKQSGREPIEKGSIVIDPSNNRNQEVDSIPSDISREKDRGPGLGDREFGKELAEQCEHFWQKLEEFLSGKYDDVEDTINIFVTTMNWIKQKDQLKDSEGHLMAEMRNLHVELQLLATMRSEGTQEGCPTKADLYSKWKGLRASLEPLMDKLIPQKEAVTKEASPSDDDNDIDNTQGCDPNMREAVAIPEASSSSQSKASKHNENKKSRKKSKGKGKRRINSRRLVDSVKRAFPSSRNSAQPNPFASPRRRMASIRSPRLQPSSTSPRADPNAAKFHTKTPSWLSNPPRRALPRLKKAPAGGSIALWDHFLCRCRNNHSSEEQEEGSSQNDCSAHQSWDSLVQDVSQLNDAIAKEEYEDAIKLKLAIAGATENDIVGTAISTMNRAIEEENYTGAAHIRDHAGAGLVGWWSGFSEDGADPYGRIIQISAEYGRYVARSYSPRQLATGRPGFPLFEIFFTRTNGEYKQQAAYLKQNENSGDLTKKFEKKSGLSNLNSSDSSKRENTLHAEDVKTIEGKDDDTNVTDGITTIQNILRDLIPGVKVRVLKLVSPGKVDRDLIAKVVEQIMEEEEESSEEDDSDEELESLESDDFGAEHDIEDIEMDSGDSTGKREGKSEVSLKVVISGLTPKLSADVPPTNLVRVPARLEKRDHMSFSIILEQDVMRSGIDEKRRTLKRKAFARQSADLLSSELAKVIPNTEKIHLKVLKDLQELLNYSVNNRQNYHSLLEATVFSHIEIPLTSDPLSGLYIGSHGMYSSNVLHLKHKYGQWQEDYTQGKMNLEFYEYVEAIKLTGDPSVPAGQVAFRAKVGKQNQLPHKGIIPEEFGVIARYKGQGRLADPGFRNPRWVDGELVIFDGKYIRGGPVIGFVYWAPESHFLLFFNRLKLPA
ncbi:UvrD/REP helicase N-terminal domain [Musa troglodytarum]|uniref:UvrD/REP helicase N-terminal domain n=1 Tax=Musa troglodytarum TaxID=320322 RepID=A0A9E7K616_9LILI|nr:UvrD/REP helicase N-terminal domain [Musa troglodytarum]